MATISILVPTANRFSELKRLLDSIAYVQTKGDEVEVLLLNNGKEELERVDSDSEYPQNGCEVRHLKLDYPGLHVGRNEGARLAHGDVLAYLDDDTEVAKKWLEAGVECIRSGRADAVAGRILPKFEAEPPGWLTSEFDLKCCGYLTLLDMGDEELEVDPNYVWGANFMIRRDLVQELGGFHPDGMPKELLAFRGDGETGFFEKFKQAGYKARYVPGAAVYHQVTRERMTREYFLMRGFRQGVSNSYTKIRADGGLEKELTAKHAKNAKIDVFGRVRDGIKWRMNAIKEHLFPKKVIELDEKALFQRKMAYAMRLGYDWHQKQVKEHPELLEWVLRAHYFGEMGRVPDVEFDPIPALD